MNFLRFFWFLGFNASENDKGLNLNTIGRDCLKEIVRHFDGKDISNFRLLSKFFYSFCSDEKLYIFEKTTNISVKNNKLTFREIMWYMNIICRNPDDNFLIGKNSHIHLLRRYYEKNQFNIYNNNLIFAKEKGFDLHSFLLKKTAILIFPLDQLKIGTKRGNLKLDNIIFDTQSFYRDGICCFQAGKEQNVINRNFNNGTKTRRKISTVHSKVFLDSFTFPVYKITGETKTICNGRDIISEFFCLWELETTVENRQLCFYNSEQKSDFFIDLENNIPFKKEIYDFSILLNLEIILFDEDKITISQNEKLELVFMIKNTIIIFYPFSKLSENNPL